MFLMFFIPKSVFTTMVQSTGRGWGQSPTEAGDFLQITLQ